MPIQTTTYNSRVTDEALEKKFRDTFKSQGGAELVDDLYAQGTIVPIVDFTAAAQGSELRSDLQTSWDYASDTNLNSAGTSNTVITTPGFWKLNVNMSVESTVADLTARLQITDGSAPKTFWRWSFSAGSATDIEANSSWDAIIFLRSGDSLKSVCSSAQIRIAVGYRQIADVYGNLVNPLGFTSS